MYQEIIALESTCRTTEQKQKDNRQENDLMRDDKRNST